MEPRKKSYPVNLMRGIALASNMSLSVGVATFLGMLVGNYVDEKIGGKGIVLCLFIVASVIIGLYGAIRNLQKQLEKKP